MQVPTVVSQSDVYRESTELSTNSDGSDGSRMVVKTPSGTLAEHSRQGPLLVGASRGSSASFFPSADSSAPSRTCSAPFASLRSTSMSNTPTMRYMSSKTSRPDSHWLSVKSFGAIRQHVLDACRCVATGKLVAAAVHTVRDGELDELADTLSRHGRIRTADIKSYFTVCLQGYTDDDMDLLLANFGCGTDALNRCHDIDPATFRGKFRTDVVEDVVARCIERVGRQESTGSNASIETHLDCGAFVEQVAQQMAREDALKTLPTTCLFMIVFIGLVIFHLNIEARHQVEKGIENWMNNYGPYDGPFVADIVDVDSFWNWLEVSGVEAMFAATRLAVDGTHEIPRVAAVNDVLGDAKIFRTLRDGSSRHVWLRHVGRLTRGHTNVSTIFDEAFAGMRYLRLSGFLPAGDVSQIKLTFCTYNEQARMFSKSELMLGLNTYGASTVTMWVWATSAQIFSSFVTTIMLDAIYVVILVYIVLCEGCDLLAAARSGWGHFLDYWDFWNAVDLASIVLGVVNMCMAYTALSWKHADSLTQLYNHNDWTTLGYISTLSPTTIQKISDDLDAMRLRLQQLHYIVAFNTVSIALRFFKAFTANRRLDILAQTLTGCLEDLIHFLLVFGAIYLSFTISGHILFGSDIEEFRTIASTANIGLAALLGAHDWYLKVCSKDTSVFASGMPVIVLHLWLLIFMLLVSLVMLNMIMAIILDSYSCAAGNLRQCKSLPTLLQQCRMQVELRRETWGFIPLKTIHDFFAHDTAQRTEPVTPSSLRQQFETMSSRQADWLPTWIGKSIHEDGHLTRDPAPAAREKRTCRFLDGAVEEMAVLGKRVQQCSLGLENINTRIGLLENCARGTATSRELPIRSFDGTSSLAKDCSCQTEYDQLPELLEQGCDRVDAQAVDGLRHDKLLLSWLRFAGPAAISHRKEDSRPCAEDDDEYALHHEQTFTSRLAIRGGICCCKGTEVKVDNSITGAASWPQIIETSRILDQSPRTQRGEATHQALTAGTHMEGEDHGGSPEVACGKSGHVSSGHV